MSLLGSIFGSTTTTSENKKEEKGNLSGLFQNSTELPDRPQHRPIAKSVKRKPDNDNDGSKSQEKKAKKRKKNKGGEEKKKSADHGEKKEDKKNTDEKEEEGSSDKDESSADDEKDESIKISEEDRTIFVGNLPIASTTRKSLAAIFKGCGPIASTRIRSVPVTGIKLPPERAGDQNLMRKVCANTSQVDDNMKSTVTGYVVFKNVDSVTKALEKNNTKVGKLRIRVDKASPTVDPSRSVFCGNLPYGAEESSLQDHFVKGCALDIGDVVGVRIIRDKESFQCKGFGYVLFREKSMIPTALKLHNSKYMKKEIRVLVCGKRFKGKKGDQTEPKYKKTQEKEKVTVGAFRRLLSKQQKEASETNKRKRGQKKATAKKAAAGGLSKRAALDKKVDKRVKKLQKRISKGMGKTRR